jgi:hypothetical protein
MHQRAASRLPNNDIDAHPLGTTAVSLPFVTAAATSPFTKILDETSPRTNDGVMGVWLVRHAYLTWSSVVVLLVRLAHVSSHRLSSRYQVKFLDVIVAVETSIHGFRSRSFGHGARRHEFAQIQAVKQRQQSRRARLTILRDQ